jgi:hypothetical protein
MELFINCCDINQQSGYEFHFLIKLLHTPVFFRGSDPPFSPGSQIIISRVVV